MASQVPTNGLFQLDSRVGDLGYDSAQFQSVRSLFSEALALFHVQSTGSRVTLFVPRGLQNVDFLPSGYNTLSGPYQPDLQKTEYNLNLLSLIGFHITNGALSRAEFVAMSTVEMLAGGFVAPVLVDKSVKIGSYTSNVATIISSRNLLGIGVVNEVDEVFLPQWTTLNAMSYMETFDQVASSTYSTFLSLVVAAHLDNFLRDAKDVTLFAPPNDAISAKLADYLLLPENEFLVTNVVGYHVVTSDVVSYLALNAEESQNKTYTTIQQSDMELTISDGAMNINNSTMVQSYGLARGVVVYRIGQLLIPAEVIDMIPARFFPMGEAASLPVASNLEQAITFPANGTFNIWSGRRGGNM